MNLRELLPKGKISEETMQALEPVFNGEILYKQEQYGEAEASYLAGLENFPPGSGGRFLIFNKLGILYEKVEKFARAMEVYESAVREGASTPFTFQRLAHLYLNAGRLPEALRHCNLGIKALKTARTNSFTEIYFWFIFQKLKRSIKRRQSQTSRPQNGQP
jgi:tetratricopeptide (TPR) repeat protein